MENTLLSHTVGTPIGNMVAIACNEGICMFEFERRKRFSDEALMLEKHFNTAISEGMNKHIEDLIKQVSQYFSGKLTEFNLPLVYVGTDFQKRVWDLLHEISFGETRTYLEQSKAYGNTEAIRAIAKANGDNKIAIIVPCHRVIGANGKLVGYGGGLWRKQWLLNHEKSILSRQTTLEL